MKLTLLLVLVGAAGTFAAALETEQEAAASYDAPVAADEEGADLQGAETFFLKHLFKPHYYGGYGGYGGYYRPSYRRSYQPYYGGYYGRSRGYNYW